MKRMMFAAAAVAVLALAATALAQTVRITHFGHLVGAPGSGVKFKESGDGDSRNVTSFAVHDFELACDDGTLGTINRTKLSGVIEVSASGAFKARDDNGTTVFKVKGQINRNKSSGTFRYSGQIEGTDGIPRACDSGRFGWITRP